MHFGPTLRLLRVHAGWTLRDLADRVGVSNAYLSRVENGHDAPPTPDRLAAIARALGLPPTTLIELADRVGPFASDYLERVPAARDLVMEIFRRELGPVELARVRAFIEDEFPAKAGASRATRSLGSMLDAERVVVGLACGEIDDVIDVAATKLAAFAGRRPHEIRTAALAREGVCSSALGSGLAVPHAIFEDATPAAVVVTLRRGLGAETPDGVPLRAFVVHVHRGDVEHARVLADLARLASDETVRALCAERDPARVVAAVLARGG